MVWARVADLFGITDKGSIAVWSPIMQRMLLLLVVIIGLILRAISINQSLWLDEAISVDVIRSYSFTSIVTQFAAADFHPPLYYLVLKLWASVAGTSEIALRSFSVFGGVASVWVLYEIGRMLWDKKVGLIAALLLVTAPLHVYYSQEARMYAMETLLVITSVYFFLRLLKNQTKWGWIWFTLTNILLVYTDYLPALVFVVYVLYAIIKQHVLHAGFIWRLFISFIITAAVFLPFLPIFYQQLQLGSTATASTWSAVLGTLSLKSFGLVIAKFLVGRISFDNKIFYAASVAVHALIAGIVLAHAFFPPTKVLRDIKHRTYSWRILRSAQISNQLLLCLLWLVIPILFGGIIALRLSIFDYFRFIFALPALHLLLARGLASITNRAYFVSGITLMVAINVLWLSVYYSNPKFHREDWRSAVRYIESVSGDDALTVFVNAEQGAGYKYYSIGRVPYSGPVDVFGKPYTTIWLMRYVYDIFDPQDTVRYGIEAAGYQKTGEYDFNRIIFCRYDKAPFVAKRGHTD